MKMAGSWYTGDLNAEVDEDLRTGHDIPHSKGYLINGELGDFANCSNGIRGLAQC